MIIDCGLSSIVLIQFQFAAFRLIFDKTDRFDSLNASVISAREISMNIVRQYFRNDWRDIPQKIASQGLPDGLVDF